MARVNSADRLCFLSRVFFNVIDAQHAHQLSEDCHLQTAKPQPDFLSIGKPESIFGFVFWRFSFHAACFSWTSIS